MGEWWGWKWELFKELLPRDNLKQIATYELHLGEEYDDRYSWVGSTDGEFSMKAALTFIKHDIGENNNFF